MVSSHSQAQSDQSDEIFLAFKEWLKIQEARHGRVQHHPHGNGSSDSHWNEFNVSPSIVPVEPSIGADSRQASFQRDGISRGRWFGRRVFRTFAYGFIIIITVGAALAWQSSDDKTKDMVRAWGISLRQLSSVLGTKSHTASDAAAEPVSKISEQASVAAGSSPEAQRQLETIVSDLAVVRRIVEQLAAKQEQMAQDIATLQAAEQNVSERKSSLPQSLAVPPRKNMQSEAAVQSPSVPIPTPRPQKPLPLH
jgi:hypothetical protein